MPGVPREYLGLMRDAIKDSSSSPSSQRPLKRRKRNRQNTPQQQNTTEAAKNSRGSPASEPILIDESTPEVKLESQSEAKSTVSPSPRQIIDLSDIEKTPEVAKLIPPEESQDLGSPDVNAEITVDDNEDNDNDDFDDDDDGDDFDEFEDVDLENVKPRASSNVTGDVNINVNEKKEEVSSKKKKKGKSKNVISREERIFRRDYHRNHIAIMAVHGFIRNKWCNSSTIHAYITKLITAKIYDELHPSKDVEMPQIRTRRFLDGLRHLLDKWSKYYKVTSNKGIIKHDWYDWYGYEKSKTPFERFAKCIAKGRGGRDIGAQGFVALLRAAGVPSRLVYSLQPPDFTCMAIKIKPESENKEESTSKNFKSASEKLLELRKGKVSESVEKKPTNNAEVELEYPVFWAEAWDPASKTWITIDPVVFKIIENIKYRSKLEPPFSYPHNNLVYVLGYDRKGGVRDITKRYSEKYYAKTRKKRISKDEKEEIWYDDFLQTLSTRGSNRADEYEDEYFKKKAISEGMPDNIQDFKNHPFYVLEGHLRSNEILHPKEHCGMIRTKGKNSSLKVYKRENVQILRSPRAWYQRGRVLKTGERPMMVKQKTANQMRDDDDDPEERLYAVFQTSLYVPPPVQNGEITKNAYGNIDVYVDSMIPDGAVLIKTPFATDAAKMVGIDYAPAVVGFKFERRGATPKMDGIVVAEEFKEAVEVVSEQLKVEASEKQRIDLELRALKGWGLLLAKLRIKHRLNAQHGKVDEDAEDGEGSEDEFARLEKEYENYMDNDSSDDEFKDDEEEEKEETHYEPGGFIVEAGQGGFEAPGGFVPEEGGFDRDNKYEEPQGGGFIQDDDEGYNSYDEQRNDSKEGHKESQDTGAGFTQDDDDYSKPTKSKFDEDDDEPYYGEGGFIVDDGDLPQESKNVDEKKDKRAVEEYGDIDEYEAFFDQLQNGEEPEEEEDDHDDEEASNNRGVIEGEEEGEEKESPSFQKDVANESWKEDLELEGAPIETIAEPVTKSTNNLIVEEETDDPFEDAKHDTEDLPVHKQDISEQSKDVNEVVPETIEIPEPQADPESENELDKQFNEQLRKEQELAQLKISQESNNSTNFEENGEEFEFDYDSD